MPRTLDETSAVEYSFERKLYKNTLNDTQHIYVKIGGEYMVEDLFRKKDFRNYELPNNLKGRSINSKVIPTVCNLENMLDKLVEVHGDFSQLKQWEKRSYKAYKIDEIKGEILNSPKHKWKEIIRKHILYGRPSDFGASCIDIYLVAYVAETYGAGKEKFFEYVRDNEISDKDNSAQAIWQVGKGDGLYLGILNDNGTIKDWDFIKKWIDGNR